MIYDLASNDRFFLNQLIPMWDAGKLVDLNNDLKYVFHREKGTNYNTAQFEYTLKTLSEFIVDHGFARDAGRAYTYNLQPKANMLMQKGSIEQFEQYLNLQKGTGFAHLSRADAAPQADAVEAPLAGTPQNLLTQKPGKFAVPANKELHDIPIERETPPVSAAATPIPAPVASTPPSPSRPVLRRAPDPTFIDKTEEKGSKAATSLFSLLRIILAVGSLFLLWYFLHDEG